MKVFKDISLLKSHLKIVKSADKQIGFVPTMGALHDGHLKLLEESKNESDYSVCSIYVNPTQFNNSSDLRQYPRLVERDLQILENKGCDVVFLPSDEVMYPNNSVLSFNFGYLEKIMEGKYRPGHFNGVAIIVSKLFHIVKPNYAYFGQKDLQQYLIISQLVKDLSFDVQLRCVEIVREPDGLAKSSRNLRLSEEERKKSVVLHKALLKAKDALLEDNLIKSIEQKANNNLEKEGLQVEYFELVDAESLKRITNINETNNVAICVAAYLGNVRLIDNIIVNMRSK